MSKVSANIIVELEQCIPSILSLYGLKRGRDYSLSKGQLFLKKAELKNKIIIALREFCPEKNYYWETPRLLKWF
jgi:hypothetical protein